jgi:hypothetical protein
MLNLRESIDALLRNERYRPIIQDFATDLHDIFEAILCDELIEKRGEALDGAEILAVCMTAFKAVAKTQPTTTLSAPMMQALPSQRYGRSQNSPGQSGNSGPGTNSSGQ